MYKDINKVLKNIHTHFESIFLETFKVEKQLRYVDFFSENYSFRVHAGFIQARIAADFEVSIEQRINEALKELTVDKGAVYDFTTKFVEEPIPTKYCIELVR